MKYSEFYGEDRSSPPPLHLDKKQLRQKRIEDFVDYWLDELSEYYEIYEHTNDSWTIHTEDFGIVDMYPKSNKLLFRETNTWIDGAAHWMRQNLIPR